MLATLRALFMVPPAFCQSLPKICDQIAPNHRYDTQTHIKQEDEITARVFSAVFVPPLRAAESETLLQHVNAHRST